MDYTMMSMYIKESKIKDLKEIFGVRKEELVEHKNFTVTSNEEIEQNLLNSMRYQNDSF